MHNYHYLNQIMDMILKMRNLVVLLMCCFRNTSVYCLGSSVHLNKDAFESTNCSISPKTARSKLLLEKYISDGFRLIRLDITVFWTNFTMGNRSYPKDMEWYMTTRQSGKRLLLLDNNFELLSLGTLSYGVVTMSLDLEQGPLDCLSAYTPDKAYDVVYYSLLTLPNSNKTTNDDENEDYNDLEVCNGYSDKPMCCRLTLFGSLKCGEHVTDKWITILKDVLYIIVFLLLSFSLKFVPRSWYDTDDSVFEFMEPFVLLLDENLSHQMYSFINAKRAGQNHTDLKTFQETGNSKWLQDLFLKIPKMNKMYRICVGFNKILAETDQLVSEVTQSSGLKYFFSRLLLFLSYICFTCRMRNIDLRLKLLCYKESLCKLYLYQCIAKILKMLLFLLFFALLLPRGIYLKYYDSRGFGLWVAGCINLFPFLMLSFCHREYLNFLRECLHLTLNQCMAERLWSLKKIVFPKRFDSQPVISCIYALLFSIPCIIYLCISFFPYPHFLFIQIVNLQQRVKNESRYACVYLCVLGFLNNVFMLAYLLVIIDTIYFFVLCFSYIFIGFVVNGSTVLPYVTFILLMCSYMYNCFHDTHTKVDKFKKAVIKILYETDDILVKKMYNLSIQSRKNLFCFLRQNSIETESIPTKQVICLDGSICWLPTCVPLFYKISKTDKLPYLHIPELFLHMAMDYSSRITPGSIYKMYWKNFRDILIMFVVLFAALHATNWFGNVHKISSVVKSLVTVGSGVIVFIFNTLFSRTSVYEIDDKDLHLKEIIKQVSKNYSELWKIEDCTNISVTETDSENEADIVKTVHNGEDTFYVNKSICQIYSEDTNTEETETCCETCFGSVILNIPGEHNGYEPIEYY